MFNYIEAWSKLKGKWEAVIAFTAEAQLLGYYEVILQVGYHFGEEVANALKELYLIERMADEIPVPEFVTSLVCNSKFNDTVDDVINNFIGEVKDWIDTFSKAYYIKDGDISYLGFAAMNLVDRDQYDQLDALLQSYQTNEKALRSIFQALNDQYVFDVHYPKGILTTLLPYMNHPFKYIAGKASNVVGRLISVICNTNQGSNFEFLQQMAQQLEVKQAIQKEIDYGTLDPNDFYAPLTPDQLKSLGLALH